MSDDKLPKTLEDIQRLFSHRVDALLEPSFMSHFLRAEKNKGLPIINIPPSTQFSPGDVVMVETRTAEFYAHPFAFEPITVTVRESDTRAVVKAVIGGHQKRIEEHLLGMTSGIPEQLKASTPPDEYAKIREVEPKPDKFTPIRNRAWRRAQKARRRRKARG